MAPQIKAVVFKTSRLKATKDFFGSKLGFMIKESSPTHFVIGSKGIRVLFIASDIDFEAELYVVRGGNSPGKNSRAEPSVLSKPSLTSCEDPNNIKIIFSEKTGNY